MDYPVDQRSAIGRKDTLFNLLASNKISVEEYKSKQRKAPGFVLRQSFESANRAFRVIESLAKV